MTKLAAVFFSTLVACYASGAKSQERTEASAHSFLVNAFSRNVTVDRSEMDAEYAGSGCAGVIQFTRRNGLRARIAIDYSKLSSVATNYTDGLMVVDFPAFDSIAGDRGTRSLSISVLMNLEIERQLQCYS